MYNYTEYRSLLKDQVLRWKSTHPGWTLQKMATRAQIQPPYLTNVLRERAHLNADQLYALGEILQWSTEETDYATLLLEKERCGRPQRRKLLEKRVQEIRKLKQKSQAHLKKTVVDTGSELYTRFYLNPFYVLINGFMGIERFAKDPVRIASCLGLDLVTLKGWIQDLVEMGFLKANGSTYEKVKRNFHLPKDSVLCEPHQLLLEKVASQHLMTLSENDKFGFTATLSADENTRQAIQSEFMKFLKAIEEKVAAAPCQDLYSMRFDLFRWSGEKAR